MPPLPSGGVQVITPTVFDHADDAAVAHFREHGWLLTAPLDAAGLADLVSWVDEVSSWPDEGDGWLHHRELTLVLRPRGNLIGSFGRAPSDHRGRPEGLELHGIDAATCGRCDECLCGLDGPVVVYARFGDDDHRRRPLKPGTRRLPDAQHEAAPSHDFCDPG